MKYVIIGIVVVIALLAWVLSRRGASGLGQHGSTDTEAGTLGQGHIGASRGSSHGGG